MIASRAGLAVSRPIYRSLALPGLQEQKSMVKKSALLAAFVVAIACGSAPRAEAQFTWMAYWGVKRWHNHYACQATNVGWDYASSGFGHHGWGSSPWHWGATIALSARPWPPFVDRFFPAGHHRGHAGYGRHHGHYGYDDCWYGYGFAPRHGHRHFHWGAPWAYGCGPLGDAVYDDVNGVIDAGEVRGVLPGGEPGREYDPVPGKKEGELVEPPAPKKSALPTTKLVLNVPAEAKVTLAGVDTKSSGASREFVTSLLAGSPWTNYSVRVELERDGQTLVDERTVTLYPGDHQVMTIDFAATQVASK
jgi:uncharacterized protein (TIGR03000 family)